VKLPACLLLGQRVLFNNRFTYTNSYKQLRCNSLQSNILAGVATLALIGGSGHFASHYPGNAQILTSYVATFHP
jgi:hypothetical protein